MIKNIIIIVLVAIVLIILGVNILNNNKPIEDAADMNTNTETSIDLQNTTNNTTPQTNDNSQDTTKSTTPDVSNTQEATIKDPLNLLNGVTSINIKAPDYDGGETGLFLDEEKRITDMTKIKKVVTYLDNTKKFDSPPQFGSIMSPIEVTFKYTNKSDNVVIFEKSSRLLAVTTGNDDGVLYEIVPDTNSLYNYVMELYNSN